MTPRAAIQQLGRMVRDDLRSGELSAGAHGVGDMLIEQPDAVLLIVDVTAAEARKTATLAPANYTLTGQLNGDVIVLNNPASGTYDTIHVGTGKTVTVAGLAISGTNAGDYVLAATTAAAAVGRITAATVTAGLTGTVTKVYNTTTAATLVPANYTLTGQVGADVVTLNNPASGTYDIANAGTGKTVTVGGLAITGANASDYVLAAATTAAPVGTITAATLTYLANTASRAYGVANPALPGTVTGFAGSETPASATTGTLAFTTPAVVTSPVGSYAITGSGLAANNGNYVFTQAAGNATALTIGTASLTITANNQSKVYGTSFTFAGSEFSATGLANGQTIGSVTLASGGAAATAQVAGSPFAIVASNATGGTFTPANYTIAYAGGLFSVSPATLTAGLTGTVTKVYDRTLTATLAPANYTLTGQLNGDVIVLNNPASGSYDTIHVGTGKTVTVTGLAVSGTNAGDYVLASTTATGLVGTVTPALLTAGLTGTVTKVFDGTAGAALGGIGYTLTGVLGTDAVILDHPAFGAYDTANAGAGKTVIVGGLAITSSNAGDYQLAATVIAAPLGTISPAPLSASLTGLVVKPFDGTTTATPTAASYSLAGAVDGAVPGITQTSGRYDTAAIGTGKTVTITGLTLSGPFAGDYQLVATTLSATVGAITTATTGNANDILITTNQLLAQISRPGYLRCSPEPLWTMTSSTPSSTLSLTVPATTSAFCSPANQNIGLGGARSSSLDYTVPHRHTAARQGLAATGDLRWRKPQPSGVDDRARHESGYCRSCQQLTH